MNQLAVGVLAGLIFLSAGGAGRSPQPQAAPASQSVGKVARDTIDVMAFDPSRLRLEGDSMAIGMSGFPEGSRVSRVERVDRGFRYTERTTLTPEVWRTTEVHFDAELVVERVFWTGSQFGVHTGGELAYEGSRVSGTVETMENGTPVESPVEATLPAGAFDGHALMALLPTLDWSPGEVYRLRLFDAVEGGSSLQTLSVVGTERVDVPAGEFLAVRGELTTTQLPVTIWVTRDVPHRVVQIASRTGETVLIR